MDFNSIKELDDFGFKGFESIGKLMVNNSAIPNKMGVYLVLYLESEIPNFLTVGTGGYFKGKNPNISVEKLNDYWVNDTIVVYIGKAGGKDSKATLRSRLNQYLRFGQGSGAGHYGGRLIWQIESSKDLKVCWKPLTNEKPRNIEANLIEEFVTKFGCFPFANLTS